MCPAPKIETPRQLQVSKEPVRRETTGTSTRGRKGTILTGGSGVENTPVVAKKTLLGA